MAILNAKVTREVCLNIFVVLPLAFLIISPLGVLFPWFWFPSASWFDRGWFWFPPGSGLLLFQFFPFFLVLFD